MTSDATGVQDYFNVNAKDFDDLYEKRGIVSRAVNRAFRHALVERLQFAIDAVRERPDSTVLDVGCGSGRTSIPLAMSGASHVVGVDFSARMLDLSRRLAHKHGVDTKCEFIETDFMRMEPRERFDVVVALGVFDYVQDAEGFLHHMAECSRGVVVASFPAPTFPRANLRKWRYGRQGCSVFFYTRREIDAIVAKVPFESTRLEPVGPGYVLIAEVGTRGR